MKRIWMMATALLALAVVTATPASAGRLYFNAVQAHYDSPSPNASQQFYGSSSSPVSPPMYVARMTHALGTIYFHAFYPADAGTTWTPTIMVRNTTTATAPNVNSCFSVSTAVAKITTPAEYHNMTFGNIVSAAVTHSTAGTFRAQYQALASFIPFNGINGTSCDSTCRDFEMIVSITRIPSAQGCTNAYTGDVEVMAFFNTYN